VGMGMKFITVSFSRLYGMQVHKVSGRSGAGKTEGDVGLPRWAAAAVDDVLLTADDDADETVVRQSASDSMLSSHSLTSPRGWSTGAVLPASAVSPSTLQSPTSLQTLRRAATRATWGPVGPAVVRRQPTSAVGSESTSVRSDSSESVGAVDRSGVQLFPTDTVTSLSKSAAKYVEKAATSLPDADDDKPVSSVTDVTCDLVDIVVEEKSGGEYSEEVSPASQESTGSEEKRLAHPVTDQRVSKETVGADEGRYVKQVADQFVGSETTPVDERIHLGMSAEERRECSSVRSVEGQHVSAETFYEHSIKPSIRIHAQRHPTQETDSSLLVCLVSPLSCYNLIQ